MDIHDRITHISLSPPSRPRWVYLPNLILLHPCPPHTLNDLSFHLIAPKAILPILLPLPRPLPPIVEAVRPLALPYAPRKRTRVLLTSRPLHFALTLEHTPTPQTSDCPSVIHDQNPLSVKLVLLETTLIHALLEVELALASPHSLDEIPLVNTPICHALFTVAVRQVIPPITLNKPSIGRCQFPLSRCRAIRHLSFIHTPIGEGHLYPFRLGQVPQEELACQTGTILPNDFTSIVGLSLDCSTSVPHSAFQLDHLDAALHRQRTPHMATCADIQIFLLRLRRRRGDGRGRGAPTGYSLRSIDDNRLPEIQPQRQGLIESFFIVPGRERFLDGRLLLVIALLDMGDVQILPAFRLFLENITHLAIPYGGLAFGTFVAHYYSYFLLLQYRVMKYRRSQGGQGVFQDVYFGDFDVFRHDGQFVVHPFDQSHTILEFLTTASTAQDYHHHSALKTSHKGVPAFLTTPCLSSQTALLQQFIGILQETDPADQFSILTDFPRPDQMLLSRCNLAEQGDFETLRSQPGHIYRRGHIPSQAMRIDKRRVHQAHLLSIPRHQSHKDSYITLSVLIGNIETTEIPIGSLLQDETTEVVGDSQGDVVG